MNHARRFSLFSLLFGLSHFAQASVGKFKVHLAYPPVLSAQVENLDQYKKGPGFHWEYDLSLGHSTSMSANGTLLTGEGNRINYFDFSVAYKHYWIGMPVHSQAETEGFGYSVYSRMRLYTGFSLGILKGVIQTTFEQQPVFPVDLINLGFPVGVEFPMGFSWGMSFKLVPGIAAGGNAGRSVRLFYTILLAGLYLEL